MHRSIFKCIFLALITIIIAYAGSAVPQIPMIVSGSVYINGAPAPAGTEIKAMMGGELKGSSTLSQPGVYGITVEYGEGSVDIYVNNIKAQSINWSSEPKTLNLSITIAQTTQAAQTTTQPQSANTATSTPSQKVTATAPTKMTPSATTNVRATDTVIPEAQKTGMEQDSQKQETVKSSGFATLIAAFTILLVSKIMTRWRKR